MLDRNLIKKKIRLIQEYQEEIKDILNLDKQEILNDLRNLKSLERNFQLIVDAMISINIHFIRELEFKAIDSLEGSFVVLGENGILPLDFAENIAPVVGLRNQLVHQYEKIDNKRFISDFKKGKKDFDQYMKYIYDYLEKTSK